MDHFIPQGVGSCEPSEICIAPCRPHDPSPMMSAGSSQLVKSSGT